MLSTNPYPDPLEQPASLLREGQLASLQYLLDQGLAEQSVSYGFVQSEQAAFPYLFTSGLSELSAALNSLSFDEQKLRKLNSRMLLSPRLYSALENFSFEGSFWSPPEGEFILAGELLLELRGNMFEVFLVESLVRIHLESHCSALSYCAQIARIGQNAKCILELDEAASGSWNQQLSKAAKACAFAECSGAANHSWRVKGHGVGRRLSLQHESSNASLQDYWHSTSQIKSLDIRPLVSKASEWNCFVEFAQKQAEAHQRLSAVGIKLEAVSWGEQEILSQKQLWEYRRQLNDLGLADIQIVLEVLPSAEHFVPGLLVDESPVSCCQFQAPRSAPNLSLEFKAFESPKKESQKAGHSLFQGWDRRPILWRWRLPSGQFWADELRLESELAPQEAPICGKQGDSVSIDQQSAWAEPLAVEQFKGGEALFRPLEISELQLRIEKSQRQCALLQQEGVSKPLKSPELEQAFSS